MKIKRIILLILIVINCAVIFIFSSEQGEVSGETSGRIVDYICNSIPAIRNMDEKSKIDLMEYVIHPLVRKLAHYSIYTMLGIITISFILTFENKLQIQIILTILFCFLYACSDEIHQLFIDGRAGSIIDIGIDTLGTSTGTFIGIFIHEVINKIKKWRK